MPTLRENFVILKKEMKRNRKKISSKRLRKVKGIQARGRRSWRVEEKNVDIRRMS